jgi:hypothetical protein
MNAQRIRVYRDAEDTKGIIIRRHVSGIKIVKDGLGIEHMRGQAHATIDGVPYVLLVSRPEKLKDVDGIAWRTRYMARSFSKILGDTEEQRQQSIKAANYIMQMHEAPTL